MSLLPSAKPLNPLSWLGLPMLACIGATILFAAPIRVLGFPLPEPVFGLIPAFAWAVIRPSMLAPFALMALGIYQDLYWGSPTGLWGLSLLVAYAGAFSVRSLMFGQSWVVSWIWFSVTAALAMGAGFFLTLLSSLTVPSLIAVFWQFVATSALYPFADRLIQRFEDADVRFR
jgi:rod shape-determining protein MreD